MDKKIILLVFLSISGVLNFVSTEMNEVNSTNSCCENLYFSSTGSLSTSEQKYVLGYYYKLSDGPEDYWNYKKNDSSSKKLWYNPDRNVQAWLVGTELGNIGINTKLQNYLAKIHYLLIRYQLRLCRSLWNKHLSGGSTKDLGVLALAKGGGKRI